MGSISSIRVLRYIPVQGLPIGAVADFLSSASIATSGCGGPRRPRAAEWDALRWIAVRSVTARGPGVFTSGGSFASFTGLVTARHAILGKQPRQAAST